MRNKRIIYVALICRRVGSKRAKALSSRKRRCYDHLSSCRQEALLQRTTFVLHACFCSCYFDCGVRASDESEYIDPCDDIDPCVFYNDVIYEYQQVQSSHDNDGREDEILSGDETSVCDSSESVPQSGCDGNLEDASDDASDAVLNERVDDVTDPIARRACTVIPHAQVVGDEALDSQGKLSHKDDDSNLALDDLYDTHSDKFSDTGYM